VLQPSAMRRHWSVPGQGLRQTDDLPGAHQGSRPLHLGDANVIERSSLVICPPTAPGIGTLVGVRIVQSIVSCGSSKVCSFIFCNLPVVVKGRRSAVVK
jgi:hypothetical protein